MSAGCQFCFAEARDRRQMIEKVSHWGPGAPRLKSKSAVKQAFSLNRKPWVCDECGAGWTLGQHASGSLNDEVCSCFGALCHRRRIFSLSLGDWLDPEVPVEWLAEMLDTIRQCRACDWLLLTKRPELWRERLTSVMRNTAEIIISKRVGMGDDALVRGGYTHWEETRDWVRRWVEQDDPPPNVWIGASVEDQDNDHRIADLLRIPAAVRFLSCEPLLGPLNLRHKLGFKNADGAEIDWVIVGGESGPNARPCNIEWIRSIVDQCKAAGVPCFVKQLGNNAVLTDGDPAAIRAAFPNVKFTSEVAWLHLKHPKGGDINEFPDYLRVREFPEVAR